MKFLTQKEADKVLTYTNGYPMTVADYLDHMNIEYTIVEGENNDAN